MTQQPSGLLLTMKCRLDAPRERIFSMLTEPEELARWWGPLGFTLPRCEIDLRAGGGYRFWMKPADGETFHLSGEYLTIEPPRLLQYSFRWDEPVPDDRETVVTLTLDAVDEATEVALSQGPFATEERLELHRQGWAESFEKLAQAVV
jgi:uncharacterized protein YndB with AHSA1/START domain